MKNMSKFIADLRERNLVNKDIAIILNESLSGLSLEHRRPWFRVKGSFNNYVTLRTFASVTRRCPYGLNPYGHRRLPSAIC